MRAPGRIREMFGAKGPSVVEVNSLEPVGSVVAQSPEAGAGASHGSGVTIEVSNGLPPSIAVPDVRGRTVTEATAILQDLQADTGVIFSIAVSFQDTTNPELVDRVITTSPGPGAQVANEGTLTLVVGQPAPPSGGGDDGGGGGDGG